MRLRTGPLLALLVASACTTSLAITDAPAGASAGTSPSSARSTMLVFLRADGASSGASRALVASYQSEVADQVAAMGGRVLARTSVPDTLEVALTASQSHVLAVNPLVTQVLPNSEIPGPVNPGQGVVSASTRPSRSPTKAPSTPTSCGTFKDPQLNPEGLANIDDVNNATEGFTGKGITVAFLADGLQIKNPDLVRSTANASVGSPAGSRVISQFEDFSGDGTQAGTDGAEAFGDAASIAAQGREIYDLSRYVSSAHPLPRGCDIRIEGSAPGASLLALKIFGEENYSTGSGFVQAINYAVAHGASVINESFGSNGFPDTSADIVRDADEAAYAAGVTVVVSSGDAGPSSTIGSPATDPDVLAVGATTQFRAYQQQTFGGINLPGESGGYLDNNISSLSSGGFAQDGKTVDLVAPGDLGWSLCSANLTHFQGCDGMDVQLFGGTSESSPLTAGAAADVIEAYTSSHGGTKPTPTQVMEILTSTAQDIGAPADEQGAGLLDVGAAVRLARSMPGTTIATPPGGILSDATQEDLSGIPGATVSSTVDVTNTSKVPATLQVYTRALVPSGGIGGRIVLNPAVNTKTPRFSIWSGAPEIYRKVTFKVPAGTARELLRAAYQYQGQASLLHVVLFDPHGRLAAYSLPQGIGDYAEIEVTRPEAGTWTAGFFTVWDGYQGSQGTSGPVPFSVDFYRWAPLGVATPGVLHLAAGETSSYAYNATLPSEPGDSDVSIVVHSPFGVTTVPVTLRTEVNLTGAGGTFVGTLDGGNGRGGAPGQTNTYDLVVPSGEQNLQVAVRLASNPGAGEIPGVQLIAMLVDPDGQTQAYDSNYSIGAGEDPVVDNGVELYVDAPAAGTWQLVLNWVQPGAGTRIAIPFRVTIGFDAVSASAPVPDSTSTSLTDNTAYPYELTITNNGIAPLIVSPDARLNATEDLTLPDLVGTATTQVLPNASNEYFVPPETTSLTITETATAEATFDAQPISGDPDLSPTSDAPYDVGSLSPTEATMTYTPPTEVASGLWGVLQAEIGPYPTTGEPEVTETTVATIVTKPFDPEVTSSAVPDTVEALTVGGSVDPDVIAPGGTVEIPITITPPASSVGTDVSGTLYVTGLTTGSFFGETIAEEPPFTSVLTAIPYAFRVVS